MNKPLVIVESPAKARTIKKCFGNKYIVKASIGHIRDLPKKSTGVKNKKLNKKQDFVSKLISQMGINPFQNWDAIYQVLPEKEKIVSKLKLLAKNATCIYLATDFDREGESIAWHLKEVIGGDSVRYKRIIFNEITKNAIHNAFKTPNDINMSWVHAQQARRFMDRIVGYMISPLLWKKIARGLSAGRVQSVALRLVVEREREIKKFIPEEHWQLLVTLTTPENVDLNLKITHQYKKNICLKNKKQVENIVHELKNLNYIVSNIQEKIIFDLPHAPFITSTLQQISSIRLGFSVKKTMQLAQKLYESGYITYMRTDSSNLSEAALFMLQNYIKKKFGVKYILEKCMQYNNKKYAQEAHEAIRPSNIDIISDHLENIENDGKKLYDLIRKQFISCQMPPAQYKKYTLTVHAENFTLTYQDRILFFDGWKKVFSSLKETKNNTKEKKFFIFKIGETLKLKNIESIKNFTKPSSRFTEASLVRELEKRGIGRPSTYATIIATIQDRGYVRIENRRFYSEKIGEIVTDRLVDNFQNLMNYNFTAYMENQLDDISKNKILWTDVLNQFFFDFHKQFINATKDFEQGGMAINKMTLTSIPCVLCGKKMGIKIASTGIFLTCIGYLDPIKKRCRNTINLFSVNKLIKLIKKNDKNNELFSCSHCLKCGMIMDNYFAFEHQLKFKICSNNPMCDGYQVKKFIFHTDTTLCYKCGSEMHIKIGRFGAFMKCTNTLCRNTQKIFSNGSIAPPKNHPIPFKELRCEKSDAYFVLHHGSSGVFLAANTYPKVLETRSPFVSELKIFKNLLPKTLHYLTKAPEQDDMGNKTIISFNKSTNEQYIFSKKNGKKTGWIAFFKNGIWKVKS